MQGFCEPFNGKRITLMGLGLLGRGVGDAAFLAECGATVLVTDKKNDEQLAASVEQLKKYPHIKFHLGGHDEKDFTAADLVIKAAGVPPDSPEIAAAKKNGVPVYMSTALFAKYAAEAGATIVGITGTRGKTTTAQMIFHSLKKAGKRALLGGNVRGTSTLAMLPEVERGDICVLELDSWQLQGFGDLQISPRIAVFTNLMPDHQNYYKNMDEYFADKANIFKYQQARDVLFVGQTLAEKVPTGTVPPAVPPQWHLKVIGAHNRENAALAAAALKALGLSAEEIRTGLESFEPVEGRLQFVREIAGVKIYNDNNATTPEATIAGLRALNGGHPMSSITLIIGGSEKGLALDELVSEIKTHVSHVLVLAHPNYKGSVRLVETLKHADVKYEETNSLEAALKAAVRETKTGTILFSPAFASFGMFQNEYERNDEFIRLVKSL